MRKLPPFGGGEYNELWCDRRALVFERRKGDQAVVVAVNRGNDEYVLRFEGTVYELLSRGKFTDKAVLAPHAAGVYYTELI